jgi:hypothetical protein
MRHGQHFRASSEQGVTIGTFEITFGGGPLEY